MPNNPSGSSNAPQSGASQALAEAKDPTLSTPDFARAKRIASTGRPAILDFMQNTIAGYDQNHPAARPEAPVDPWADDETTEMEIVEVGMVSLRQSKLSAASAAPVTPVITPVTRRDLVASAAPVSKSCAYLGDVSSLLNSRAKQAPTDLCSALIAKAGEIVALARQYKQIFAAGKSALNFVDHMQKSEEAIMQLRECIERVAAPDLLDVLAYANEQMMSSGLRIEQVPGSREIWLGIQGESKSFSPATRIREAG